MMDTVETERGPAGAAQTSGRLAGKTALVTGGASGFGRGIVERFAAEGAAVSVLDLDGEGAARVAAAIGAAGGRAVSAAADVCDRAGMEAAVAAAEAAHGPLDIVVNNAGYAHRNQPLMGVSEAEFDRCFDVNVKAIFHMTQLMVPRWRAHGGGVMLNIGSTAGIRPRPGLTWYNASKGAANLMSRSLAGELAPDRIRVNCIAPVIGVTGLLETFMGVPDTPENRARFIATIPLGRMSEVEDVTNAALYLCSDEAAFITGVVLEVDGGRTV
ncbi:MAG: glucose 1-dehydrogenase [Pseudomonadota bacterium]